MMKLAKSLLSAMLIIMLVLTMGVSAFAYNDVADDSESKPAIEFIDKLGIIQSTWDGDFKPDQYLTRADAIVAVYRTITGGDINPEEYEEAANSIKYLKSGDTGDIESTSMLRYYLAWAVDNFLIATTTADTLFKPSEAITANELLTLLSKLLMLHDAEAVYPDNYTESVSDIIKNIEAGDTPVTREAAAVAFAATIMAVDGTAGELGVYEDFDGKSLNSLATTVFGMSSIDLVIRATTSRNLGYTVKNGVLLSNGADVDLGADLSEYVGYGINIVYRDADSSRTFTEDEEIHTYTVSSTNTANITLSDITIDSGHSISVTSETGTINFGTGTYFYLNDEPWPTDDPQYDLVELVAALNVVTRVQNRPGFRFKCMQAAEGDAAYATVFATESRPAKLLGINNGYYTVYDYYNAGLESAYKTFNVSDCEFATTIKVGDYISYYESNGTYYISSGTAITSPVYFIKDGTADSYTLKDGVIIAPHAFRSFGSTAIKTDAEGKGPEYTFVLDDSGKNFYVTWEIAETNYAELIVDEIKNEDGKLRSLIKATNLNTGAQVEFYVDFVNINSATEVKAGDFINYSDNGAEENAVVYIRKNAPKTVEVKDMGNYFIELDSDKVYYKNKHYAGDINGADFTSGLCVLNLDMANAVVSIEVK